MPRYTIHVNTPCISTMPAVVHFLISFHNHNLSLLTVVPVTLFRNSMLRCTRSKLAFLVWKLKPRKSGTINTKTKTVAHNRVREKDRVHLHNRKTLPRQNLRAIPNGVFITTHAVSEPESANSHARSTMIVLTCSNFTPKTQVFNTSICRYVNTQLLLLSYRGAARIFLGGGAEVMEAKALKRKDCLRLE